MPPTTRARKPQGSGKWAHQEPPEDDIDVSSNFDSDDEGIPSISPHKQKLHSQVTLSVRHLSAKRHVDVKEDQLRQSKRHKPSRSENATWRLRPGSSNGYPTPDSARNNRPLPVDGASSNDASSLRTTIEEEEYNSVDPAMLAMVISSCGMMRRSRSPTQQLHANAQATEDRHSEISDIDLNNHKVPIMMKNMGEQELEDTDLSVQPTKLIMPAIAESLSQPQVYRGDDNLSFSDARQGLEPVQAIGEQMEEPKLIHEEPVLSSHDFVSLKNLYETQSSPERPSAAPKSPKEKPQGSPWMQKQKERRQMLTAELVSSTHKDKSPEKPTEPVHVGLLVPAKPITRMRMVEEVDDHEDLLSPFHLVSGPGDQPTVSSPKFAQPIVEEMPEETRISDHVDSADDKTRLSGKNVKAVILYETTGVSESDAACDYGDDQNAGENIGQQETLHREHISNNDPPTIHYNQPIIVASTYETEDEYDNLETHFLKDVQKCREARHSHTDGFNSEDDSTFIDTQANTHSITTQLSSRTVSQANGLMKRLGWSALTKNWENRLTREKRPRTLPGKNLAKLLLKLERFVSMTPSSPHIVAQNRFLSEYNDVLKHYLYAVDIIVDTIRSDRLSFTCLESQSLNQNRSARQKMTEDLVRFLIPLMIRVLSRAWSLGGDGSETAFTVSTLQILSRQIGWIEKLYSPLMRELGIHPLNGNATGPHARAREALKPMLDELRKLCSEAPDRLRKEEDSRKRSESIRQSLLRKQEEIKIERKRKAEQRLKDIEAHNRRVAQAIRRTPSNSNFAFAHVYWRREEETSLCTHLQGAFDYSPPCLPELGLISFKLGHSDHEVKSKSRDLLLVMLSEAYPAKSRTNVQHMVGDLLQQWS